MNELLSWLVIGILLEIAAILFILFRQIYQSFWGRGCLTLMTVFSLAMVVLCLAVFLGERRVLEFSEQEESTIIAAFVIFGVVAIALARVKRWPYRKNAAGERARARDEANPPPKRSLASDALGCAVTGVFALVLVVVGIAAAIALVH